MTAEFWLSKMGDWYVPEPNTGCWLWMRTLTGAGYGGQSLFGKKRLAHRISYELLRGPIPAGLQIDHLCRCRSCVNPDHMETITRRENILRGMSPLAINARKTHCRHGHEFTAENTYVCDNRGSLGRMCKRCNAIRKAATYKPAKRPYEPEPR